VSASSWKPAYPLSFPTNHDHRRQHAHDHFDHVPLGELLIRAAVVLAAALASGGCGDTSSMSMPDMAAAGGGGDMAVMSICGHPGDVGNSLGVGRYCLKSNDCSMNTKATLCATLGSPNATFCTFPCDGTIDMGTQCGENASCQCQGGACGCFPKSCL
jgi:hypothetical protein